MPIKLVIDCSTGITSEVELTAEEIAQAEADAITFAAERADREAQLAAEQAAKESAIAKLLALGLTAEEAAAIVGI